MKRGLVPSLALLAVVGAGAVVAGTRAYGHEGWPLVLEAKYTEIRRGTSLKRMVFVQGHAHYPDGTRLKVGMRVEDDRQYLCWYDAVVNKQAFLVEMGPFTKEFASGLYVVEAWFSWDDQSGSTQAAIKKAEEGLPNGVDRCRPEIRKLRADCIEKRVYGAAVVQVGTPGRFLLEEEEACAFLKRASELLSGVFQDMQSELLRHADPGKAEDVNRDAWMGKIGEWGPRIAELDNAVLAWHATKMTVRHQKAYAAAMRAVSDLRGLLAAYGRQLYDLADDAIVESPERIQGDLTKQLEEIEEDLKSK